MVSEGCSLEKARAQTQRRPFRTALVLELVLDELDSLDVLGLPALGAFDNVELNGLTFLQAAETAGLDGRVVNENVFAVLTADEAVALRVIEPLNCSLFHGVTYSFEIDVARFERIVKQAGVLRGRNCCVQRRSIEHLNDSSVTTVAQANSS
jgi:hypothetical protein